MEVKTRGLILREAHYKDADKILTVLARGRGKLTVSARGAKRKGYRFSASAQLLAYSELTLFIYRDRARLNDAELINAFLPLRDDIESITLGSYVAELCEALSQEGEESDELLDLALNTLYALSKSPASGRLIKAAFELRALSAAGFEPSLGGCAVCGESGMLAPHLHLGQGEAHCGDCRKFLPPGISMPLSVGALDAMRYCVYGEPRRLFAFSLSEADLEVFSDTCEAYVLSKLERGFGTLDFWKRVRAGG